MALEGIELGKHVKTLSLPKPGVFACFNGGTEQAGTTGRYSTLSYGGSAVKRFGVVTRVPGGSFPARHD